MSISVRFYLFTDAGMQRIPQRVMEGLCHGEDAMPQFAETKQRVANVIVELDDGKPSRILEATGSYLHFDKHGKVHESLVRGGFEAMETYEALERSKRIAPSKIVDLSPKLNRKKWEREHRWQPSARDLDEISADIWRKKKADSAIVIQAKGAKPIPPKMTFEATEAIREIQSHLSRVDFKLEDLSEAALKGVAFEARSLAAEDFNNSVWLGVAEAADRRREILARHRTGKGIWYASIEVTHGMLPGTQADAKVSFTKNVIRRKRPKKLREDYWQRTRSTSAPRHPSRLTLFVTSSGMVKNEGR